MLLVVGSQHFANPGRDIVNVKVDDVFSDKRQREIALIVEKLAAFRPTHIAIEWDPRAQDRLDAHYGGYTRGIEALSRREADQLGVRLAAKLGLEKIHAVDWNDGPVIYGQGHAYLLRQFAKESGALRVVDVATVLKGRLSAR